MAHPLDYVESFFARQSSVRKVGLSRYRYYPQALFDSNITHETSIENLRHHYQECLKQLAPDEELAFNSRVWSGTESQPQEQHMPLVDFVTRDQGCVVKISEQLIAELGATSAALSFSGRSFHLYIGTLISYSAWLRFMARIHLLNLRGGPEVIDSRWAAHRVLGGQAALRWSANSALHRTSPEIVQVW